MATAAGGPPPSYPGGHNDELPPLPSVPPTSNVPPIPSVLSQQGELEKYPSSVFKTFPSSDSKENGSPPLLPLIQVPPAMLPVPPGSSTPWVGNASSSTTVRNEIRDEFEDAEPISGSPGNVKEGSKTASQVETREKQARPSSVLLSISPRLADIADTRFSLPGDDDREEEGEKAGNPEKNAVEEPPKSSAGTSAATSASHAAARSVSENEVDQALDALLADYVDQARPASSSSTTSKWGSSPPANTDPGATAPSDAGKEKAGPAPKQKPATSAQPASPSTTNPSDPAGGKNAPAPASSSQPLPPSTPQTASPSSTSPQVSASTPQTSAQAPKPDPFVSISGKSKRVSRDSGDEADANIDGTGSLKSTREKKSPRSEKADKAKRRSQTKAALTLNPRYVPDTRKSDVKVQPHPTLEQCRTLLKLLEEGCGEELRQHVLGAVAGMVFELPERDRDDVLERAWRYARLLPDAPLRQWAGLVLAGHEVAKDAVVASSADSSKGFTALMSGMKGYVARNQWDSLAQSLADEKLETQSRLMATARVLESINDLKSDADIGRATAALKKKLDAKLLVLAFFQSSTCPNGALLRAAVDHTASAVLRRILAGDAKVIKAFKAMASAGTVADSLAKALLSWVKELVSERASRQPGSTRPAPMTTADNRPDVTTSSSPANSASTSATTSVLRQVVSVKETILDIVQELLLLEGQTGMPDATNLPDRSICRLIGALELDREAALRAVGSVTYNDVPSFIHGVGVATLTPLSCDALLRSSARDATGKQEPLLHHLMASGDMRVACGYLRKLAGSTIPSQDFLKLLYARDGDGVTAIESAMKRGRVRNIESFIDLVAELGALKPDDQLAVLAARRSDNTPALLGVIGGKDPQTREGVCAYVRSLLGQGAFGIRDVLAILSEADDDGNQPLRRALIMNDAGVVSGMVQAICEDGRLDAEQKTALLIGRMEEPGKAVDFQERAMSAYYAAVKKKYQEHFPKAAVPKRKEISAFGADKITYFTRQEMNTFDQAIPAKNAQERVKRLDGRANSLSPMMSLLPENMRKELREIGRRLMSMERSKEVSSFHMALRTGQAQSVASYIRALLEYGARDADLKPIDLVLATDAAGNPALLNAMENDEYGAVAAYVEEVLSSGLAINDKYSLLKPYGENGYTPLQVAMAAGNYRAMHAYIAAVLGASLQDADKQQLLLAVGKNGKSARQTVVALAQGKPETHGKCLQVFDAMINESNLGTTIKLFLTEAYTGASTAKKS